MEQASVLAVKCDSWRLAMAGRYVWSRRPDTYFLRSNECVIAATLQNMNPSPCRECDDGEFGSKFVTVVVSGNQQNELGYVAYQVRRGAPRRAQRGAG
jgi:hypothetical protein